jgi:hypothetical protein
MVYVTRKRTSTGEGKVSSRSSTRPARYECKKRMSASRKGGVMYGGRERRWRTTKPCRNPRVLEYPGFEVVGAVVQIRWASKEPCGTGYGGTSC